MKKKKLKNKLVKKRNLKKYQEEKIGIIKGSYADLLGLGIIILLGIIIYSNSFNCSFHFDDTNRIVDNMAIRNLSDVKAMWNYSQTRFIAYYSFAVNYHFGELNVWGYHLFNLIIHIVNACLVYWLTMLIFSSPTIKDHGISKDKKVIAFFTALLFVSHPLATQSVTYIVQRMSSMVAMFYLLSLALYLKARLAHKSNLLKYPLFAGSLISAILAMLTKENGFTLPFSILLAEIFILQTKKLSINFKDYRVILLITGFLGFILIILFSFSSSIFKPILLDITNDYGTLTSLSYLFTQFSVIVKYIGLLILPIDLNLDYDFPISNSFFEISTIMSFLFLLSLIILAIFLFNKNRIISFGIFWFFITLSIESSIIPLRDLIFEHRTYLPSFGFFIMLSSGLYLLIWNKYKYMAISVFALLIGSYSFFTYERNKVWKDEVTLWSDVIFKSPNKPRAYNNRGVDWEKRKRPDEAIRDYNKAIELNPDYFKAYNNRGNLLRNDKKYDEALSDYNKAIELNPNYVEAYVNRGTVFFDKRLSDQALVDFSRAITLDPDNAKTFYNRGNMFFSENKFDRALEDYTKSIELNPNYANVYFNRGNLFNTENRFDKAIEDYTKALELDPNYAEVYMNRGTVFKSENQLDKALEDYTKAIELHPNNAEAYNNRGSVYVTMKKYREGIKDLNKTIELNPELALAYANRGVAELSLGDKENSCLDFKKAVELGFKPIEAIYNKNCK